MTKNADDATKNSLKISKILSCLLSNGFVDPIYNEYIWFPAHVKIKTKEGYLPLEKKQDTNIKSFFECRILTSIFCLTSF